jgi:hypothetical protein
MVHANKGIGQRPSFLGAAQDQDLHTPATLSNHRPPAVDIQHVHVARLPGGPLCGDRNNTTRKTQVLKHFYDNQRTKLLNHNAIVKAAG